MISFILQCNPGVGLKAFFDMVHLKPKKLILFGAACSPVTDQIAKAAKHWNLVQLTYADTHPMFTEKSFPHFYRVVPSENEFNPPRLSMLRYYNWTRVGTLYQNMAKYALVSGHEFMNHFCHKEMLDLFKMNPRSAIFS